MLNSSQFLLVSALPRSQLVDFYYHSSPKKCIPGQPDGQSPKLKIKLEREREIVPHLTSGRS
jgi:hypothetical protein